jgi:ABC-2 type transport system permease protein
MFQTLIAKEFREQWRTWKLVVFLAVFLITGMISPVLAKYTPQLLGSIPNLPAGMAALIPTPTVADAVTQFLKNTSQFGILLVILLTMGVMAQEKERGTAAMLLTKPVNRSAMVLAKWLTGLSVLLAGVIIDGLACYAYTAVLFEALPIGAYLTLCLLIWVYLSVYLSVALMASTLARTQAIAAAGAFGGLIILLILESLPRVNDYMPAKLTGWGASLVLGHASPAWSALIVAIGLLNDMVEQIVQWEYQVTTIGSSFGTKNEQIEATLNEWGVEGWEAVNVFTPSNSGKITIVAKRPLSASSRRLRSMP